MIKMKIIKTVFQKIFLLIALIVEIPLCILMFFLDAIIGGIFVLAMFVFRYKKGMNHSTELMFEFAGFLIMCVAVTFATLLGNNLNELC